MRVVLFDLETDGLLKTVSVIWCVCLRIIEDGVMSPIYSYMGDEIDDAISIIESADVIVGHNIIGYDLKVIEKLYFDFEPKDGQIIRDTLVLSQMMFADEKDRDYRRFERGELEGKLIGRHTLEAWGQRFGYPKGDYAKIMKERGLDPWKQFDFELGVPYCVQDVEITTLLWKKIEGRPWEEESIRLEHQIAYLMDLQEESGFAFDIDAAEALEKEVRTEYDKLYIEAVAHFGTWITADKWSKSPEPRAQFGEDASRRTWAEVVVPTKDIRYKEVLKGSRVAGAPYCPIKIKEFNPNSRPMIIDRLTKIYEWEPVDFTEKGNPEVNDDVLRGLAHQWPICDTLAELFFLNKLLGALSDGDNGWLRLVGDDNRMHGRVIVGGTRSGRASHASPNVAQVKKVSVVDVKAKDGSFNSKVLGSDGQPRPECFKDDGSLKKSVVLHGRLGEYGWECRSLFTAPNYQDPDGWWLMGCDLKGVELRCFGHHLAEFDGGAYANEILNGDIHSKNQEAAGLPTRDKAKTFIYATLYGGGDAKIGSIVCDPNTLESTMKARGKDLKRKFQQSVPAFGKLIQKIAKQYRKNKQLTGLDGRILYIKSQHSALNLQLQSDGALLAKKWVCIFYEDMLEAGYVYNEDFFLCAWVHDEIQVACRTKDIALHAGKIAEAAALKAGEFFNYRVPIEADSKIGRTWASTH